MTRPTDHWNKAYEAGERSVSWFQQEAGRSLELIDSVARQNAGLIDVGGGASHLVDGLLDRGFTDLTVLDLARAGIEIAERRLGARAQAVEWIVTDLLEWRPRRRWEIWHDRAMLHFLTAPADRARYASTLAEAVTPGGHAVIGCFAEDAPERCSGLPVERAAPAELAALFENDFDVIRHERELHRTPGGREQPFNWIIARRR